MFKDRKDAGRKLAKSLEKYKDRGVVVLAIPKGGVEVGFEVAKYLNADFNLLISRKLPFPHNPESGFGAISEDGSTFIISQASAWLAAGEIEEIKEQQYQEIERRISKLRASKPLPDISGKTVILVDDGLAMGSTMRASIKYCSNQRVGKIVVAVPVSSAEAAREISSLVDEVVVLEKPVNFRAVAQVYKNWYDVSDEEVLKILGKWEEFKQKN
ncbi:MAG: phosphoribosyltransferase [Actinomycetota bacterium]